MFQWYVIKTKPKKEKEVFVRLGQAGYEMFLPQIEGITAPNPLFPSYLFILGDLKEAMHNRLVRYTQGVSYILGDDAGPQPICNEIIQTLKDRTSDGSIIEQRLLFHEGDSVRVRKGILKDLVGIIERRLPDQKRVEVLFKWWATSVRAKLRYTELERAA